MSHVTAKLLLVVTLASNQEGGWSTYHYRYNA